MAYIVKQIGDNYNQPTYFFECDDIEDLDNIPLLMVPMGSRCFVINEGVKYALNSKQEWKVVKDGAVSEEDKEEDTESEEVRSNAVEYVEQTLTEEQQMTARKNLGLYYKAKEKTWLIEEQRVTFEDNGLAETTNAVDWLEYCESNIYNGADVILTVDGVQYNGILSYYSIPQFYQCDFGAYRFESNTLSIQDGATAQIGDTVTVSMYFFDEIVGTLDFEFLPEELTEEQKSTARKRIGAPVSVKTQLYPNGSDSVNHQRFSVKNFSRIEQFIINAFLDDDTPSTNSYYATVVANTGEIDQRMWFEFLVGEEEMTRVTGYLVVTETDEGYVMDVNINPAGSFNWDFISVYACMTEYVDFAEF